MPEEEFLGALKIVTGEEVLSKVTYVNDENGNYLVLENPIVVEEVTMDSRVGAKVSPWMKFSKERSFIVPMDRIVTCVECDIEVSMFYEMSIEKIDHHPNSLIIEPGEEKNISENLSCSLFRSLCPVTAQPDWATIYISYSGNAINHSGLLRYLLSYRNHQGFHEECVERIFVDILKRCRLEKLSVKANFLRRGGIEINPIRTTPDYSTDLFREVRQ